MAHNAAHRIAAANSHRKRSPEEREQQLVTIAERILKGESQYSIAKDLGVSQQQISNDMKEVKRRWNERTMEAYGEHVARQLAEITIVKRNAWDGWEKSRGAKRWAKASAKGATNASTPAFTEKQTGEEQRDGNPQFLDVVMRAMEKEARLLGLDKSSISGYVDLTTLSHEQLQRLAKGESLESVLAYASAPAASDTSAGD